MYLTAATPKVVNNAKALMTAVPTMGADPPQSPLSPPPWYVTEQAAAADGDRNSNAVMLASTVTTRLTTWPAAGAPLRLINPPEDDRLPLQGYANRWSLSTIATGG
jgi:hypothetical protein